MIYILTKKQFVNVFLINIILLILSKKENVQTLRSYLLNIHLIVSLLLLFFII